LGNIDLDEQDSIACYGFVHNGRMTVDGDYMLTITFRQGQEASIVKRNFDSGDKVAIALLKDNAASVGAKPREKPDEDIKAAAMLSKNAEFQKFLGATDEAGAAEIIRTRLNIASRAELRVNTEAKKELHKLRREFLEWKRSSKPNVDAMDEF